METIYLDRNESQYGPAPACYDVLARTGREELSTYTRDFDRGVKSRVSERLAFRLGIPEKQVILGYGAELILKMAVHRFVGTGERLLVPDASWWYYGAIATEVGADTVTYRVIPESDAWRYDAGEITRAYDEHTPAAILIASPNNPTGNAISREVLNDVLRHCSQSIVIIDEAYWGYGSADESYVSEILAEFDNVIFIRSFSKYFALAGVRMGYAIAGDRFRDFAKYTTLFLGYQQIAENIVLAALDSPDYYSQLARWVEADKESFYSGLADYECITCYRSEANFLLFKMHPDVTPRLKERLAEVGMKPKFFTEPQFVDHMRLSLGTSEQNALILNTMIAVAREFQGSSHGYQLAV